MNKKNEFVRGKPKNKSGFTFSIIHKVIPFLIILISFIMATQKCAREINYDDTIIGKPLIIVHGQPFYPPWAIVFAWLVSATKGNFGIGDIVYNDLKIVVTGLIFAIIIYFILVYIRSAMNKEDKNFLASGRWGNDKDLVNSGLASENGVVIGQRYNAEIKTDSSDGLKLYIKKTAPLIMYNTNVCGMLMAGTRLGKGISTVVPTHMMYPNSIISIDPKGENYDITAGERIKFSYVYKYTPVSRESLFYNILDDLDEQFCYRDANMVAGILTEPDNPNSNADPHWQQTAQVLLTSAILHCKCSDYPDKSLPGVYSFLTGKDMIGKVKGDVKRNVLQKMINSQHCRSDIHQCIISGASQIASAADEELGSIFSSALEALSVFNDPIVAETSRTSDFTLNDFKYSEYPISWYLCIPFADLKRLKSLCRAIIEFVCNKFSQGLAKHGSEGLKHRILIIIDEFPTLGKMECIETFAGILNGYGISFLWICQSKAQIDKLYGQNAPILEHCRFMWTYAINDDAVAGYFSKRIGTEGIIKQNTSNSGSRYDYGMNNLSISSDITERSLMTANEIENLAPDSELIFTQGFPTQLAKKVAFYSDPRFKDKANLPKPETRKEMLTQTETSRVLRDGDEKWWENFDKSGNECSYYAEEDVEIDNSNSEGGINTQIDSEISEEDKKDFATVIV